MENVLLKHIFIDVCLGLLFGPCEFGSCCSLSRAEQAFTFALQA
jgi:hypothetical protein